MVTVDCRGMTCPQPLINTRNAVRNGADELEVIVDNPMSQENCTRFLIKADSASRTRRTLTASSTLRPDA